jgi:CheY-like chemotaxis protein
VPKILVVDDDPVNRKLLSALLRRAGHDVVEAENGTQGLDAARSSQPDLVIMDLYMPEMDGPAFVRALRRDTAIAQLPVALYTSTTPNPALRDFMKIHGIAHIIPKPSEPETVLSVVRSALAGD